MIKPKIVIDAYRKAYNYAEDAYIEYPVAAVKFLEEYLLQDALDEFQNTTPIWLPNAKPVRQAKEVALDAATKITIAYFELRGKYGAGSKEQPSEVVFLAKEIYEWLTEPETDKR